MIIMIIMFGQLVKRWQYYVQIASAAISLTKSTACLDSEYDYAKKATIPFHSTIKCFCDQKMKQKNVSKHTRG